ncbi:Hypothetical predicted protein [Podarcis lilfordi]|uniref:Uncharacterized protein n=1 Tax=Podarcis lilfordi TaxID=74358 RepID=A0AA35L0N3_9SAUR|nr:Hypothetical predicted protein [Podarcis lilfordi]
MQSGDFSAILSLIPARTSTTQQLIYSIHLDASVEEQKKLTIYDAYLGGARGECFSVSLSLLLTHFIFLLETLFLERNFAGRFSVCVLSHSIIHTLRTLIWK